MLSMGLVKNMGLLNIVYGMIEVSLKYDDNELQDRTANKNHKLNKRIDRRLRTLQQTIQDFIHDQNQENKTALAKRFKKQSHTINVIQNLVKDEVTLEMLAIYVLFVRFCEKETHESVAIFNMPEFYMDTVELCRQCDYPDISGEELEERCMLRAYEALERIEL